MIREIRVAARPRDSFASAATGRALGALAGRVTAPTIWHVNSTAAGGGVAEMLPSLIAEARNVGVRMRWLVVDGTDEFFAVTKRLHHALHGSGGDGSALGEHARDAYERVLAPAAEALVSRLRPGDAVVLHDPQTAGLVPAVAAAGHRVAWRCHIGDDAVNDEVRTGWAFLRPYLAEADAYVFSRATYVPEQLDPGRVVIVPPSIDPASAKNESLSRDAVKATLVQAGLIGGRRRSGAITIAAADGVERTVRRTAQVTFEGALPDWRVPLAVQISRWDPLKDFSGVMRGFAGLAANGGVPRGARLLLAGPGVDSVADDPEASATFASVAREWRELPAGVRSQICLAQLPTRDIVENATIVNALQRHATVVVQKSLREGFGLTVTEAMWKARPVLASGVGGIRDQIVDGVSGRILSDPADLDAYAHALGDLLERSTEAARLGREARKVVRARFLSVRHLRQYMELFAEFGEMNAA